MNCVKNLVLVSLAAGLAAPVLADTVDDILLQKKLSGAYEQDNGNVVVDGRTAPCDDALMLTCGDSIMGSTVNGTNYVGNPAPDVFYQVLVPVGGAAVFSLCTTSPSWDSYLRLYNGCPTSGGVEIAYNDDSACGLLSELSVTLTAGTYWLVVEGYYNYSGAYTLTIACTPPAPCAFPCDYTISPGPGSYVGSIASYEADWYCVTGSTDLTLISTCNTVTDYDTKLELWYNDPDVGCVQLAYDDDDYDCAIGGLFTTLGDADNPFTMVNGGEYFIKVYGYSTSAGTYRLDLNGGQVVSADDQPVAFALGQNVPNPFNPTTAIAYSMPATGLASLKVFDVSGRAVATLVDGMVAKGQHTVNFDASSLSSGVYFYTLQAGTTVETKKMVLMK